MKKTLLPCLSLLAGMMIGAPVTAAVSARRGGQAR